MRRAAPVCWLLAAVTLMAAPAAARYVLTGRIELPDGAPAAGIAVELVRATNAYRFGELILGGRHYPDPAARALTRPDGGYELEAPEAGMWHLYVASDGHRPMELQLLIFRDRILPTLELIAETRVTVRVTGSDGKPLAGAHVRAEPPPAQGASRGGSDGWGPAYRQAFTDGRGAAAIGRGPDEALQLYAIGGGHLEAERAGVTGRAVELRLEAATPRSLRVEDLQGRPVAAALVRLGERRWPIGLTSAEGLIELPLPGSGEPLVHVIGSRGERLETRLDLAPSRVEEPLAVTLEPPFRRSGRIVDRDTRRPIPGAFAWVSGRTADAVQADSTGSFTLDMPADSKAWVWGAAQGYLTEYAQIDPDGEDAASPAEATLALQATARARGVIVDENDRPVADAEVKAMVSPRGRLNRAAWRASSSLEPAVSDPRGRFSIDNLHPDAAYVLRASKPGYATHEFDLPDPRADSARGVRIVLERGRVAVGTVVSSAGEPIAGARIELEKSLGSGPIQQMMRARALGREAVIEGSTDETGRFEVPDLPAAIFDLEVTAPGYAPASLVAVEISSDAGETDLGEITLEPGATVEGRVTDSRGSAVEGAQVFAAGSESEFTFVVRSRGLEEPAAVSDADGFFSVPDRLAGERVDLTIRRPGYAQASVLGVEAPTVRPLAVKLDRASKIRGEVVDADGRPVGGARVWVTVTVTRGRSTTSRPGEHATTGEDGRFVIESIDPGQIQLSVEADGYRTAELTSLVVEPERDLDDVRVVLEPGAAVAGRVTDTSGRPVANAMIMLSEGGLAFSVQSSAQSDGEGRYRLEGVAPGRRSVTAHHEGHQPVTREIEVQLGDNTLDLVFEGGATLSGRVLDESGEPISGAHVEIAQRAMMRFQSQGDVSDTAGAFSIGGVPEGTVTLQAYKEGFATALLEGLEVGPGDLPGLEIRMSPGSAIAGRLLGLEPSEYGSVHVMAIRAPSTFSMGRVDRAGNYRIEDLAPGDYHVSARTGQGSRMAQAEATVVEGAGETLLDLEFGGGLTLTGTVLGGSEPLGGVSVSASGLDVASNSGGTTSSEGRFEMRGLDPGRHVLTVSDFQSGLSHREELELQSDRDVVVRVESATVSGTVVDATDSSPLAGVSLRLEPLEPPTAVEGFAVRAMATTDSTGSFRFARASAGVHRLVAHKDGYAPAEATLTVIDGFDQDDLELWLEPTAGVRVFVTLPSGQPAVEFFASVLDAAGRSTLAGVFAGGREGARLSVPPGSWELLVSARGTAVSSTPITLPSDPIGITLREPALLAIRVPDLEGSSGLAVARVTRPDGRPFRHVQWTFIQSEWSLVGGRGQVLGLEPGTWTVTVEAPDGRTWQGQASLAAGENPELVLQ